MKRLMISALTAVLVYCGAACMAQTLNQPSYDVNKDVHNQTNQPAYGFKIVLRGTPTLTSHYDGIPGTWRFREFGASAGSDSGGATTVLYWNNPADGNGMAGPIPHCQWVHVGYRLEQAADLLEAYWTDINGESIGKVEQATQIFRLVDRTLSVTIKNALRDGSQLTVQVFGYCVWDGQLALDSLNPGNSALDSAFSPVPGVGEITLDPGQSRTFSVQIPASLAARDKPPSLLLKKGKDGVFMDYAQFSPGEWPPIPHPAVSQGALILMVMLVLGTGAVVIARRARHTTA
jgi:hypothetical protein